MSDMKKWRKIVESLNGNAEFDRGHNDISQTNSIGGNKGDFETTNKGRADIKSRRANPRYGDNTMKDIAEEDQIINEFDGFDPNTANTFVPSPDSSIIDRLQAMFQKAGIADEEIRAGIDLTPKGMQKVAARLGISAEEVPMLLGSLTTRLRDDEKHEEEAYESMYEDIMNEDGGDRFGYEKDASGNVTVRDSQTDKEIYLQGDQATDLLKRLQQDPESEQDILAGLGPLMESFDGPEIEESDDFRKEMKQDSGTFNFPWKVGMEHGTGTAKYKFDGDNLKVVLLSVRDTMGDSINPKSSIRSKIESIAHEFIKNEGE